MKRDNDLVRSVLLAIEAEALFQPKTYAFQFANRKLTVDGYSDEEVYGHLLMLLESPFVEGERFLSGEIKIKRLTWEGREFLDAVRGDDVWNKTKATAENFGGVGVRFLWEIAKEVIKAELLKRGLHIG